MRGIGIALACFLWCPGATGDSHATLGIGALGVLPGPDLGGWTGVSVCPKGPVGGRLDLWATRGLRPTHLEASLSYQLAATRPHLVLSGHAGLGMAFSSTSPTFVAGLSAELGHALGPFRILSDTALYMDLGGDEPVLLRWVVGVGAGF